MAPISCMNCGQYLEQCDLGEHIRNVHIAGFANPQPVRHASPLYASQPDIRGRRLGSPSSDLRSAPYIPSPRLQFGAQQQPIFRQPPPQAVVTTSTVSSGIISRGESPQCDFLEDVTSTYSKRIRDSRILSKREHQAACASYMGKVPICATLIEQLYTHLTLCLNGRSFLDKLREILARWQGEDHLTWLLQRKQIEADLLLLFTESQTEVHKCYLKQGQQPKLGSDANCIAALLATTLTGSTARDFYQLKGDHAQTLIDDLQTLFDSPGTEPVMRPLFLHGLIRLSRKSTRFPSRLSLKGVEYDRKMVIRGGYGDVYKGSWEGRAVAVKVARLYDESTRDKILKSFSSEAVIWCNVNHENLVPFHGVYRPPGEDVTICLVSPWMDNGNINQYLQRYPNTNRLPLILDVARGLQYLHTMKPAIIHSDLKGDNILMTASGKACIADFGIAATRNGFMMNVFSCTQTQSICGTLRWAAPEILADVPVDQPTQHTCMSDMHAFGCVCYQIYTGKVPYWETESFTTVLKHIMSGRGLVRPSRSECASRDLNDELWNFMAACWQLNPSGRPTASSAVDFLQSQQNQA